LHSVHIFTIYLLVAVSLFCIYSFSWG